MIRAGAAMLLVAAPLALAACQKASSDEASHAVAPSGAVGVPCALHGDRAFSSRCSVERGTMGKDLVLVIHHPDGGFRRLLVTADGRGVVAADGSEQATVSIVGPGMIDVTLGDDRYRLPATVKGQALPAK